VHVLEAPDGNEVRGQMAQVVRTERVERVAGRLLRRRRHAPVIAPLQSRRKTA
jgi:hypothetical protein